MSNKYDYQCFKNRELSWIQFDERILGEAEDEKNLLFERLKFLAITASNLDEFFMVRVASLKNMVHAGYDKPDIAGMTPLQQLEKIGEGTHRFVQEQYRVYNKVLMPLAKENGLRLLDRHEDMTEEEAAYADRFFMEQVYPVLTPMAVDSSRPFPLVSGKTLNLCAFMQKRQEGSPREFAMVQVPGVLPRLVKLPSSQEGVTSVIFLEQIIERNIGKLFLNYRISSVGLFRVMRNADFDLDEDEAEDLLEEIEKQLKLRRRGDVIRLETEKGMDPELQGFLQKELSVESEDVYSIVGPLDLTVLMKVYGLPGFDHLKVSAHKPAPVAALSGEGDIFSKIREGDVFLHHPYYSFEPVVDFVRQASVDPDVLAIKQTLYRVSGNSPIVSALAKAAENGKQVTVLVELKARFDEENNINWARQLEKAGCHVIYGLVGLKTHCKITLVVRREEEGIRRYVHLGTGNYNDSTAKLYSDVGMFTCRESYGEDATAVFNMLSGYSEPRTWNRLSLAPLWLKKKFLSLIKREEEHAKEGRGGRIIAKMNSLCDKDIIEALYDASAAGVKIDLIIRGICCLQTGIPGISENITVRSLVGNFLEHARIYYFENDRKPEVYCASADWMPRNLERRVEILFPLEDQKLKDGAMRILEMQLRDNMKAHILQADGSYAKVNRRGAEPVCAQEEFCKEARESVKTGDSNRESRVFIPVTSHPGEQA